LEWMHREQPELNIASVGEEKRENCGGESGERWKEGMGGSI